MTLLTYSWPPLILGSHKRKWQLQMLVGHGLHWQICLLFSERYMENIGFSEQRFTAGMYQTLCPKRLLFRQRKHSFFCPGDERFRSNLKKAEFAERKSAARLNFCCESITLGAYKILTCWRSDGWTELIKNVYIMGPRGCGCLLLFIQRTQET